jgi:late competence protein required for DNA uptake (superfamily II DNA/RNA helicase)
MKEKATRTENRMRCPRCDGAMVFERFQATMEVFYAWRCLNCGEIMDPVVAKNREQERNQKKKAVGE